MGPEGTSASFGWVTVWSGSTSNKNVSNFDNGIYIARLRFEDGGLGGSDTFYYNFMFAMRGGNTNVYNRIDNTIEWGRGENTTLECIGGDVNRIYRWQ
jgi:hypothetical protein